MRAELLQSLLVQLHGANPDVEASAVLSPDGLVIASLLAEGVDDERLGAMGAALLALAQRAARELSRGQPEQLLLKCSGGYLLLAQAGPEALLALLCRAQVRLGQALLDLKRACDSVERVL